MTDTRAPHFIQQLIIEQLSNGVHQGIVTRFPPEPNGYLHIGHAKSIVLNFGLAHRFSGQCFLRFDDTNPMKEEQEYVESIIEDVQWLGYQWDKITYSSDYYQHLFDYAVLLIQSGLAYVDDLTMEDIRSYRGTLSTPGQNSPYRDRSVEDNLDLFLRMKDGEFEEGSRVLRAKIDMASANLNLRDPVLYRIRKAHHQRTGDAWCIYPMYDYAHPISDALEGITHSLCTLEFQDHRPLYDWFIEHLPVPARPVQTEFSRLNLSHTVTSKRKLKELVDLGIVSGWDDPRLPTLKGMRTRGYPALAIRHFCDQIGISKSDSLIDMSLLEASVRDTLNTTAKRLLCVLSPLKVVIDNYPNDEMITLQVPYHPQHPEMGSRSMVLTKEIYIDRSDFMEHPPKNYHRLSVGAEVRLRHAYIVRCTDVIRDAAGEIIELHVQMDWDTLGKNPTDRKVKGVIHWVSVQHHHLIEIVQYDRLFTVEHPGAMDDWLAHLNPESLIRSQGYAEMSLKEAALGEVFQFEREGYYAVSHRQSSGVSSCHRIVALKDSWGSKIC